MSRFFRTSGTPIVEYGYQYPVEIIAAALENRQGAYDKNKADWEAQIQAIEDTPYLKLGLGDEQAYAELKSKYDKLINEVPVDADYSRINSQLNSLKREINSDFGANGVGSGLRGRYDEYYTGLKELDKRREKNLLTDEDIFLAKQKLNKFYNENNEINSIGLQNFSDRVDVGKYALEFISKVPEEKRDRFLRYDPKNPNSMYGYIVKETEEGKQFINELQQYLMTIPGFKSGMSRDIEYRNLTQGDIEAQNNLKDRMEIISSIDNQILKMEEMKKNPKAFGTTIKEIEEGINEFNIMKQSYDDPKSQNYIKDENIQAERYLKEQVAPFTGMEYKNITRDLETDWIVKANYEHTLALDRQKKAKELEEAANRTTFIANGQITPNQVASELVKLPEHIAKADETIKKENATVQNIYSKAGAIQANIRMKFTNPAEYEKQVAAQKEVETKVDNLMDGRYIAEQNGTTADYYKTLSVEDKEFVQTYYNSFVLARQAAADAYVQKQNFEQLQEAYFPKEVKQTESFNKAYNKYSNEVNTLAYDHESKKINQSILKSKMSKEAFYAAILAGEKIPGITNIERTKEEILKEAGITDEGLVTKLAWSKNLDKSIVEPANKLINKNNIGNFETIGGANAGQLATEYFGDEGYTVSALPVISPTGNMQNALQLNLKSTSGKTLNLVVDPGNENAPVFMDMFADMYRDGKAKGDKTLMEYGALGIFSNTFSGQTSMAISKAADDKGKPISLVYNGQVISITPKVQIADEWQYRAAINGKELERNNSPIQGDITKIFTEIGVELMEEVYGN